MSHTMSVILESPLDMTDIPDVVRMRFEASDGSRGVLPGHERSRAVAMPGPIELVRVGEDGEERTSFAATEGGVLWITGVATRVVCRWYAFAEDLAILRAEVERRATERSSVEAEARAWAHRHELATRRALVRLKRSAYQP